MAVIPPLRVCSKDYSQTTLLMIKLLAVDNL